MAKDRSPSRFYLLTCPRTASNLLMKILALEGQSNVAYREDGGYFFSPLHLLRYDLNCVGTHVEELTLEQKEKQIACIKSCYNTLVQHVEDAESNGKLVIVKEHTHYLTDPVAETEFLHGEGCVTNELPWVMHGMDDLVQSTDGRSTHNKTVFSDDFLKTWRPIFLIRHPALAFPSWYRAAVRADGEEKARSTQGKLACKKVMTLRWTRRLYDFYMQESNNTSATGRNLGEGRDKGMWPLVLDADDIMTQPEVIIRFCNIVGLDSDKLKFNWEKDEQQRRPGIMAFRSTIDSSTKIDPSKAAGDVDIDQEAAKWREEFGEEIGRLVEEYVRAAMPDYTYLKSKKLVA
ncbi:hypothetical protein TRV_01398 [Trichophyton verrucosum HKI 0517]|uniref:Sulfotransferase family protein n=1 Tax=Trichophyton verrucosum (strain HKI 0517) TaxID=663202 RepID=D4D2U2_TRIVH|nr:uncharacterized protein TRV_01398 [Trichophyton verrucosum HKI 0517]EFE43824.1 hypothetical protein TRV_01398 [Trichophyton verrucosum HKI 0517]